LRSSKAYFLDANVLMYAAGSAHPLRQPCREALTKAVDQEVSLITDAEVLQEILHRYFSIGRPEAARTVHGSAIDLCDEVIPIAGEHTTRALELLLEHRSLTPRDAIHVATMESHGLELLLSTDRDFDGLSQVERVDPTQFPL
jgi:predicted nucleic acid-binding protein